MTLPHCLLLPPGRTTGSFCPETTPTPSPGNPVYGPVLLERPLTSTPGRRSAVEGEYCDPHTGGAGGLLAEAHGTQEAIEWVPVWYPAAHVVSPAAPGMWPFRRGGWDPRLVGHPFGPLIPNRLCVLRPGWSVVFFHCPFFSLIKGVGRAGMRARAERTGSNSVMLQKPRPIFKSLRNNKKFC